MINIGLMLLIPRSPPEDVMTDPQHRPTTPDDALAELLAGNERFVTGARIHPHQDAERRAALANAQRPFAVVFGCSDSRLAAEIIFDRGLGDLFVVRTAGHIVGPEVLASIEYGITILGATLLVVLGHDSCGAIQATHDALAGRYTPTEATQVIVDRIRPCLDRAAERGLTDLDAVSDTHIQMTVDDLAHTALAGAVVAKECVVVGMAYRLEDGRVTVIASSDDPQDPK
jgi:carbonic anhydrase